jgi:drug/metabolite transporter (DMT)-like permease
MAACGFLFFGEKMKIRFLLALPLAIAGLLLVVGFDWQALSPGYKTGIGFGLLTALCYTVFLLLLRNIQSAKEAAARFTPLMFVSLFSAVSLAASLFVTGTSFAIPTLSGAIPLVCLGLFSQAIGWVLIANAMPKIRASFTGLILLLQPSLSFVWDVAFFSRPTTFLHWLGVAITLAAIYLGLTGSTRR